jgi:cobalamin synthase
VRVDAFAIRLRPRSNFEAADLGVRLCQTAARSVYSCYLVVWLPVTAMALASYEIKPWLPALVLLWSKSWLDRTILFALSRAAFGQTTRPGDLWREQRHVWWTQLFLTLTLRRLSPWRSFTQPVYQLEGLRGKELSARVRQIRHGRTRAGLAITSAFGCAETALIVALLSLIGWFAPQGYDRGLLWTLAGDTGGWLDAIGTLAYALTIGFLEPFYVAAGFALYLNRRAELEAWDIEQEFRRAFAD